MPKPIDRLGLGPQRTVIANQDGSWTIIVTPPQWSGMKSEDMSVNLTDVQYQGFKKWLRGELLIQDALPTVSADDREILMTGIGPGEWALRFKEED